MSATHQHKCATCGRPWKCIQPPCKVLPAIKINRSGPFCMLCRYLEMARRVARLRKATLVDAARRYEVLRKKGAHGHYQ